MNPALFGDVANDMPAPQRRGFGAGTAAPPTAASAPTPAASATQQQITPTYLSALFGDGLPSQSPAQIGNIPSTAAQQIGAPNLWGAVQATGGTGYAPAMSGVDLSSTDFIQKIMSGMMPAFTQGNRGLDEALGAAGIVGQQAIDAKGTLGMSQAAQAQGALQPALLNLLGLNLSQSQGNQNASNDASRFGISNRLGVLGQDASNQIGVGEANQNADLTSQHYNQDAAQQGAEFNANQQSQSDQFNIANVIKAAMGDQGTANNFLSQLMGYQNSDWLAQLGVTSNIATTGQGGQTGAYQPVFQQPTPVNFSGLASALVPAATGGGGGGGAAPSPAGLPPGMWA